MVAMLIIELDLAIGLLNLGKTVSFLRSFKGDGEIDTRRV